MRLEPDGNVSAGPDLDAVELIAGPPAASVLLLCDHASNALPPEYGTLGLAKAEFERHIAYDIGARVVTHRLAAHLNAPAVLSRYSRLLIDCNRGEDDPTLIMRLSDGAIIPANRSFDQAEREKRITRVYRPYHDAISKRIDETLAAGSIPFLLSIHSFTHAWRSVPRPWHAAVLWDKDPRLALPLIAELSAGGDIVVGDNEPYTGKLRGDCLWQHGTSRGLPHAIVEIRQDLIATEPGQIEWAERLAAAMQCILAAAATDPDVRAIRFYGSHTD